VQSNSKIHTIADSLSAGFSEPRRDALWGHIYLKPEFEAITRAPSFVRLHRILQLGPANLVYPGATHTRAAHSLGVYHIARRILQNLDLESLGFITPAGITSFLCASLLHDTGHFPYAHSLKEIIGVRHEELSDACIRAEPLNTLLKNAGADPQMTAAIINNNNREGETVQSAGTANELNFYRKLLSGVTDPDKLDYLNRDARYCGVPYGAQDVDFILSVLVASKTEGVNIKPAGITSVESILFSKYLMYKTVYWHHSVRAATAMVKHALLCAFKNGVIKPEDLFFLDDNSFFTLIENCVKDEPALELALNAKEGRLYAMLYEFPFDSECGETTLDVQNRINLENILADELSHATGLKIPGGKVIVDVPEEISFESGLQVVNGDAGSFGDISIIFKNTNSSVFAKALRTVRVFIDRSFIDKDTQNRLQSVELKVLMRNLLK
jgi:HD superfamily phosphohydrolase